MDGHGGSRVAAFEAEFARRLAANEPRSTELPALICFREALAIIGVSRNTLYRLCRRGEIPGVKKVAGTWRFHRQTLLDFLACKAESPPKVAAQVGTPLDLESLLKRDSIGVVPLGNDDDEQLDLTTVVQGLGGRHVDALPLPPGKVIRLAQPSIDRTYQPRTIWLAVSAIGASINLWDLEIRFYLDGRPCGRRVRASEFVTDDGAPRRVRFPRVRGDTLTVGNLERLTVDVEHHGQRGTVSSICVTVDCDSNQHAQWARWSTKSAPLGRHHGSVPESPPAPQVDLAAKYRELEQRHARLRARFDELAAIVSDLSGAH